MKLLFDLVDEFLVGLQAVGDCLSREPLLSCLSAGEAALEAGQAGLQGEDVLGQITHSALLSGVGFQLLL